jgi:tripartite-type tricarboxylate transporter receptor subunit TctC
MITKRVFLSESAAFGLSLMPTVSAIMGSPAQAAEYPVGPVKIIVAQAAGGSLDVILRIAAGELSKAWGQQVVVLNMPAGGTGAIAARAAASAAPDGHSLFMAGASLFTILPEIQTNLLFDVGDFVPIAMTGEQPMAVVVSPSLNVNTLPELITLSKKQSGGLNCAVGTRNSFAHFTAELFRSRAGANLNFIYYPGTAQSLNDVIAGRVPILVNILPGMAGAIAGGQVKLLSVTSPTRLRSFPDIPITGEAVPGFAVSGWTVLVAPRGTPPAIVQKVNADLRAAQARPAFQDKLDQLGTYARSMSPQEVADFIRSERDFWRPLVQEAVAKLQ